MAYCCDILVIVVGTIWILTIITADQSQENGSVAASRDPFYRNHPCFRQNHSTNFMGTCCNQSLIFDNIQNGKNSTHYWKECKGIKSTGNETTIGAYWRVYTCVLSKFLPSGQRTISLASFTNISIANYPEDIKSAITDLLESVTTSSSESWMTNEISVSNYKKIDKIRAQYYDIEKLACGEDKSTTDITTYSNGKPWKECNWREEINHRGSTCCGNYTVPFERNRPELNLFEISFTSTCNQTMAKLYEKSGFHWLLELQCGVACSLVEKSNISIEDVVNLKESDPPPMELVVKALHSYLPLKTQKKMAKQGLDMYNSSFVEEDVESFLAHMGNTTAIEEKRNVLFKCGLYTEAMYLLHSSERSLDCSDE